MILGKNFDYLFLEILLQLDEITFIIISQSIVIGEKYSLLVLSQLIAIGGNILY
jgi:hypothetical protein